MIESDVARAYDSWAATYDADENQTRDLDAAVLRRAGLLRIHDGDVIELGCGTGKNTEWLAEHARTVLAFDFSPAMLAHARRRVVAGHVRFVQHDLRNRWPAADASADAVVGNLVLEHVEVLAPVYAEAVRTLRPGGQMLLSELHPERQRRGGQAHFLDAATGGAVRVRSYVHSIAEFVNEGIASGMQLMHLGEWLEHDAPAATPPRLLSLLFTKPPVTGSGRAGSPQDGIS